MHRRVWRPPPTEGIPGVRRGRRRPSGAARRPQTAVELTIHGTRSSRGLATAQNADELEVLLEMARAEEPVLDAQPRVVAAALRALAVLEQRADRGREALEVARVDEAAGLTVGDLVLDAPDARADHRLALPHRLAHGQPEALGEALLHDDVRARLQGVDHRRVLLAVVHGQRREVHARADVGGELLARALAVLEHLAALRVVVDGLDVGPGEDEVRVAVRRDALGEALDHAEGVLEAVPA